MEIEEQLDVFFKDPKQKVLFFKGAWGSGKSFFVRDYLKKEKNFIPAYQYFVSLFGIETLGEVREAINSSLTIKGANDDSEPVSKGMHFWKKSNDFIKTIPTIEGIPFGNIASFGNSIFWLIAKRRKSVIIFDDLERADIAAHQILGLASSLAENSQAKIIIIFHDQKIKENDSAKLNEYREKVVDVEILYKPSIKSLVETYLKESSITQQVTMLLQGVDAPNIRLIFKINFYLQQFKELVGKSGIKLTPEECVRVAKIVCIRYLSKKDITQSQIDGGFFGLNFGKEKQTEEVRELDDLVKKINVFPPYPLDGLVFEVIQNGYCSSESKLKYIDKYHDNVARDKFNADSIRAYSHYGDNFLGTAQQIFQDMRVFLDEHSSNIQTQQFIGHLKFLKSIDYPNFDTASETWKQKHLALIKRLSTPDEQHVMAGFLLPSKSVEEFITALENSTQTKLNPLEIMRKLTKGGTWNAGDMILLESLSEEDIYNWITTDDDKGLIDTLREFRKYGTSGSDPAASANAKLQAALNKIAGRSKLDDIRVENLFARQQR